MYHGSLFSGIGGFDLAAEWMGWKNVFHCEWNKFGQKVLKYYWPNAISYENICTTDFTIHKGKIDIITGGFPCQPYSTAGKRLGKEDDRHLWPEMLRAIKEIQPSWIVGENVRGITNWNGGLVFDEVQADLETEGYEVMPFLLPACAVNAPHRRDRIWFVAHTNDQRGSDGFGQIQRENEKIPKWHNNAQFSNSNIKHDATNSQSIRQEHTLENGELERTRFRLSDKRNAWDSFPSVSPICVGNDGISERLDFITFSKWRNESIKAGGNAIVPQVAHQIFKAIDLYNKKTGHFCPA